MVSTRLIAVMAALAWPALAAADGPREVEPGARIRLTAPSVARKILVGTLIADDGESIVVRVGGRTERIVVPRDAVTRMEVQRLPSRRGKGAAVGLFTGALVGGVLGYALGDDCSKTWLCLFPPATAMKAGIVIGAPLGALVGAGAVRGAVWQEVSSGRPRVAVTPFMGRGHRMGGTVVLTF
jgi:uncharacterized protein YcfJ